MFYFRIQILLFFTFKIYLNLTKLLQIYIKSTHRCTSIVFFCYLKRKLSTLIFRRTFQFLSPRGPCATPRTATTIWKYVFFFQKLQIFNWKPYFFLSAAVIEFQSKFLHILLHSLEQTCISWCNVWLGIGKPNFFDFLLPLCQLLLEVHDESKRLWWLENISYRCVSG